MRISSFAYLRRLVNLTFLSNYKLLIFILYVVLLLSPNRLVLAQNIIQKNKSKQGSITVAEGAQIYSADPGFNSQISQKNINIEGSVVSYKDDDGIQKLIVTNKKIKRNQEKNFASQVKESIKKKKEESLKKIKKELAQYEKQRANYQPDKIDSPCSSGHSFNVQYHFQDCAVPSVSSNYLPKIFTSQYSYAVKLALDYLHSQKYTFYNNRSFNHYFFEVFSVRPPPVLA